MVLLDMLALVLIAALSPCFDGLIRGGYMVDLASAAANTAYTFSLFALETAFGN